jgi:hypothetical protein
MNSDFGTKAERAARGAAVCAAILGLAGCGLDKLSVPGFVGPAELALSVKVTAVPDIITADGFSTSLVQATVRDQNGRAVSGKAVFFSIADSAGRPADIGTLRTATGQVAIDVGTGVQIATDGQGIAQVAYVAPYRTDATANQSILVTARPVGDDANAQLNRSVRIDLRSAEPRLFPQVPDNALPNCSFIVEATAKEANCTAITTCRIPVGSAANFQSTSSDKDGTIIRYEWFFGDGSAVQYYPDTVHVFKTSGTFTTTHRVTDNAGGQAACQATFTVF